MQDTAFADNLFSVSARREGLQIKADIVSAFAAVFGITIATTKLRTFAKCWGTDPSGWSNGDYQLTVRDMQWAPTAISVVYSNFSTLTSVFRYLGAHIDSNNSYNQQRKLLLQQIREACSEARFKHASPETIVMALTTSLHRKVSFPAKFMPWSLTSLRTLDVPVNQLLKHHLRFMPTTSPAALYMPVDVGGLGLSCLSTQITLDKFAMFHRGLLSDPHAV